VRVSCGANRTTAAYTKNPGLKPLSFCPPVQEPEGSCSLHPSVREAESSYSFRHPFMNLKVSVPFAYQQHNGGSMGLQAHEKHALQQQRLEARKTLKARQKHHGLPPGEATEDVHHAEESSASGRNGSPRGAALRAARRAPANKRGQAWPSAPAPARSPRNKVRQCPPTPACGRYR